MSEQEQERKNTGAQALLDVFAWAHPGSAAFVGFVTAGYPTLSSTCEALASLQKGGADVLELGVPFSDATADGGTIQAASHEALENAQKETGKPLSFGTCLDIVKEARAAPYNVTAPIVLMTYLNPVLQHNGGNVEETMKQTREAGADGFILVDLPTIGHGGHSQTERLMSALRAEGLAVVPLVTPTTSEGRLRALCAEANSFVYCVSRTGVTGTSEVSRSLPEFLSRVREATDKPLAVGFGISTREHFDFVQQHAEGVVIGSQIIRVLGKAAPNARGSALEEYAREVTAGRPHRGAHEHSASESHVTKSDKQASSIDSPLPSSFGEFGGCYASETLMFALEELEAAYIKLRDDPEFVGELRSYYPYMGRPSSMHLAPRLTEECGGARIWLKREDLNHTGAHKINNALWQGILAKRLGKKRIIAETGAGQHGVATATACAKLGLDCTVYMGAEDCERQSLNVFRMKILGAKVVPVESGSRTLKDAINEAMRDWVANVETTHYLIGSAIGPHPFPTIVRDFQTVIGKEAREQMLEAAGKLPDYALACVGGGSNAIGLFHPFIEDKEVHLVGVEAAGSGVESGQHSATLVAGTPGVLHGTRTYLLQTTEGQVYETHSISAGLDYPGVGPEHAWLKASGRAEYVPATDEDAMAGFTALSKLEGIIPALESAHAIAHAMKLAKTLPKDKDVLVCVSGRGDKDMITVAKRMGVELLT